MAASSVLQLALAAAAFTLSAAAPANAQDRRGQDWPAVKCELYKRSYDNALAHHGPRGIGAEFRQQQDAFIAAGCTERIDVCPRSPEEIQLANTVIILAMNHGLASTFMPFQCRKP